MSASARLAVAYLDGVWHQSHPVYMWIEQGMLQIAGKEVIRQTPLFLVNWPATEGLAADRVATLPHGGSLHGLNAASWDQWVHLHQAQLSGHRQAHISRKWSAIAVALLLAVSALGYGCSWQFRP